MATNKMQAIKLNKLKKLVEQVKPELDAVLTDMGAAVDMNTSVANCIALNGYMHQRLLDNGFNDARLCGGKAAFGFNKTKHGIVDYGYSGDETRMFVNEVDDLQENKYFGHCWIELKKLGVIVDLTLPDLPKVIAISNARFGIEESEFLLSGKMIVDKLDTHTFDAIFAGQTGYHYAANSESTERVKIGFERFAQAMREGGIYHG